MRKLVICILLFVACKATSPPPPPVIERAVTLTVNNPGGSGLILSRITPSAAASNPMPSTPPGELLEARARFGERISHLVIDFLSPVPPNARHIVVESEMLLDEVGFICNIAPGSYDIVSTTQPTIPPTTEERTRPSASAPRYGTVDLTLAQVSNHRRRPSRRGGAVY